jgi:3-methyladenine DNA glycosylase AlkD
MINPNHIVNTVRQKLISLSDSQTKKSAERFFKEPILVYGVKSAAVQIVAKSARKEIKTLDKKTIF